MFDVDREAKVSGKQALFEFGIELYQVKSNLSSFLRVLCFFKVNSFDSCAAFHFEEDGSDQVPSLSEILMGNRDMKLPIHSFMSELVLSMPVHSAQLRVQFNKTIIAKCLIVSLF